MVRSINNSFHPPCHIFSFNVFAFLNNANVPILGRLSVEHWGNSTWRVKVLLTPPSFQRSLYAVLKNFEFNQYSLAFLITTYTYYAPIYRLLSLSEYYVMATQSQLWLPCSLRINMQKPWNYIISRRRESSGKNRILLRKSNRSDSLRVSVEFT